MSREDNGTEYVFLLPDKTLRFEIVYERNEVFKFMSMHKAVMAEPLRMVPVYEAGDQPFTCPKCGLRTQAVQGYNAEGFELCPNGHNLFLVEAPDENDGDKPSGHPSGLDPDAITGPGEWGVDADGVYIGDSEDMP